MWNELCRAGDLFQV